MRLDKDFGFTVALLGLSWFLCLFGNEITFGSIQALKLLCNRAVKSRKSNNLELSNQLMVETCENLLLHLISCLLSHSLYLSKGLLRYRRNAQVVHYKVGGIQKPNNFLKRDCENSFLCIFFFWKVLQAAKICNISKIAHVSAA